MNSEVIMNNQTKSSHKKSDRLNHRRGSKNSTSSDTNKKNKSREPSVQKEIDKDPIIDKIEQKTNGVAENGSAENGSVENGSEKTSYTIEHTQIHTEIIVEEVLPGEEIPSDSECHIEPLILVDDVEIEAENEKTPEQPVISSDDREINDSQILSESSPSQPESFPSQVNGNQSSHEEFSDVKLNQNVSVQIDKMQPLENGESQQDEENTPEETKDKSTFDLPLSCEISLDNSSTAANYSGNNSTQNIDLSIRNDSYQLPYDDDSNDSSNSFTQQTKNLSFAKSLKMISARKSIGDLRQESFRNIRKQHDPVIGKVFGQPRPESYSLKRKFESSSSDSNISKKLKSEDNGFFSNYFSNPFNTIRNKFSRTQTDVPPSDNPDNQTDEPKRWCSIQ